MSARVYPTVAEAIAIQQDLIERFGGAHGVRDRGRLEAAVLRPQSGYYESIVDEAAALMESLSNNHAFVDGNKRLSFTLTDVFLRLNGSYLDVGAGDAYEFMVGAIAQSNFRFPAIREWIIAHLKQL
jgi:death-on-curing protein